MTMAHCSCPLFRFGWPVLLLEIGLFPIQTDSKPSHPAKPKLNPTPKDLIPASPKLTSLLFSLHHDRYKFDDKKPDAPALRIQFAHFPFKLPDHDEQQNGVPR